MGFWALRSGLGSLGFKVFRAQGFGTLVVFLLWILGVLGFWEGSRAYRHHSGIAAGAATKLAGQPNGRI